MSTTVHVVRHGRTPLNATGRFRGLADPMLDDAGLAEAARVAAVLADRPLAAVATSPLLRARQTALAIAGPHGVQPFPMRELIDLDHGIWTGLTVEEAQIRAPDEFRRFREDPRSCTTPSGERVAAVEHRMRRALEVLSHRHPDDEVAAVSHEIPIRLLWTGLIGVDGGAVWDLVIPTAGVLTVQGEGGTWEIVATPD